MKTFFDGKKKKLGTSWHVLIPMDIANMLQEDKEYTFTIEEKEAQSNGSGLSL